MGSLEKKIKMIEIKREGLTHKIKEINKTNENKRRFTLGLGEVDEYSNFREKSVSRVLSSPINY